MSKKALLTLLVTTLIACGQDPFEPYGSPTLSVASGDDQSGVAGLPLEPFTVMAMDGEGNAMDGAEVAWFVTTGEGLFGVSAGGEARLVSSIANVTDQGTAKAVLLPTSVGTVEVTAYASQPHRAQIGSASFTVHIDAVAITLDESIDWEAPWPVGPQGAAVDVGTPVQWRPVLPCCGHHLLAIGVPAGGTPFDTMLVPTDSVFEFVPDVPGTWTWVWEHEIDDWWIPETVADTATLVVRAPT